MKPSSGFRAYLRFSKKERLGLFLLLFIITSLALTPFLWNYKNQLDEPAVDSSWTKALRELPSPAHREPGQRSAPFSAPAADPDFRHSRSSLFFFDPNTIDANGLKELGLRERTIRILLNYRNKGSQFRKPTDLQKIYGLHPEEFERLRPYISIQEQNRSTYKNNYYDHANSTERNVESKASRQHPIDINTADTTEFKTLYGIGSKLAARIVNFREKLGGFYTVDQVGETYGVPDSTFNKIKPYLQLKNPQLQQLDIQTASYEALKAHPYISNKLAYLIVKERKQGGIYSVETLKELVAETHDSIDKLVPYIRFE